ncbi:ATP-dependent helicase/nuclease subunit A [subsurface metagenome]
MAEQALDDDLFSFKLYDQPQVKQLSEFVIKLKEACPERSRGDRSLAPPPVGGVRLAPTPAVGVGRLTQVKKSLAWRYRFGDAYILPAKTSVTQLTHRSDEYIKFDYTRALQRQPAALMVADGGRVASSSAAWGWLGTATHLVISQLDLAEPVTQKAIEKTKDKLLADNAIAASVAERIDTEAILTFFHSDLGQMVFDTPNTIFREWPFTFALPACEWNSSYLPRHTTSDIRDTIIVQGIIDMLVRTPQGLVIIDFKTDNVTSSQVNQRAELYRRQLDLYSRAASAILGRRQASLKSESIAKWLYFLTPACAIEVK